MNSFTFYKNYYELIKYLSDKKRLELYDGILKYMFENEEPKFNDLLYGIWVNLKMPLDTSKNNSGRGGRPKKKEIKKENPLKTDLKPKENPLKTDKETNNISYFLFLISNNNYKYIINNSNIYNKIIEWLEYKQERKELYKETGLRNLLSEIENNIEIYGEDLLVKLISHCMANNYKGIIFEKLKKVEQKKTPEWFNKEIKEEQASDEEIKKLEERMKNR